MTVAVPAAKGAKGSDVSVPIRVVGAPGGGALHVELTFDSTVLEPKPTSAGQLAKNALVDSNPTKGRLVMGLVSSDKIEGDGEILVAHFHVIGAKGQKTPLTLEKVQSWEGTLDRLDIRVTAQAGEFSVTAKSASFPAQMITTGQVIQRRCVGWLARRFRGNWQSLSDRRAQLRANRRR